MPACDVEGGVDGAGEWPDVVRNRRLPGLEPRPGDVRPHHQIARPAAAQEEALQLLEIGGELLWRDGARPLVPDEAKQIRLL